jgi:ABC-2 type transport system permease protein
LRRNWAAARLAVLSQLEYRFNFTVDAVIQPVLTGAIEVTLWMAILRGIGKDHLGGFGREYYLAYAIWANFVGRVTINWMYEFKMIEDIDLGRVNSILIRPISFYEFYLSQFLGYKVMVALASFVVPVGVCLAFGAPMHLERLPVMIVLILIYLVFVHTVSFSVACLAFFLNRAFSFSVVKNVATWALTGELIPLDLYPEPLRSFLVSLPFASGVYVPVGFITGRFGYDLLIRSFTSIVLGIAASGLIAAWIWRSGLRAYSGTGA